MPTFEKWCDLKPISTLGNVLLVQKKFDLTQSVMNLMHPSPLGFMAPLHRPNLFEDHIWFTSRLAHDLALKWHPVSIIIKCGRSLPGSYLLSAMSSTYRFITSSLLALIDILFPSWRYVILRETKTLWFYPSLIHPCSFHPIWNSSTLCLHFSTNYNLAHIGEVMNMWKRRKTNCQYLTYETQANQDILQIQSHKLELQKDKTAQLEDKFQEQEHGRDQEITMILKTVNCQAHQILLLQRANNEHEQALTRGHHSHPSIQHNPASSIGSVAMQKEDNGLQLNQGKTGNAEHHQKVDTNLKL